MERYNLPTGGIEVIINEGSKTPYRDTVNAVSPKTQLPERGQVPNIRKKKPLCYLATRSLMLVGVFALIGNIPVYSKISTPDKEDYLANIETHLDDGYSHYPSNDLVELNLPAAIETYAGHEQKPLPPANTGRWALRHIKRGETLQNILNTLKVATETTDLLKNTSVKKELSQLKADKKIFVQIDGKKIEQLIYATGKRKAFIVSLQDSEYVGKWDNTLFEEQHSRIAFTIRNPFHYDANKAGLPVSVTRQLTKIFKKDVDFRRIKIGDQVSVIFEDYYYQSERIFTNKVLAAEFNHHNVVHQRVRFAMGDNKALYLKPNDDVEIKQVAFGRYPLKGSGRLSSGFGVRRHPVLRKRRMHSGVDFAAPRGTPIYATGDGQVNFVGRKGGYGKSIELKHGGNIITRYGHMSKYKKGLTPGTRVKRGDVIGYVGSTGRSTGNHVHYEFHVNGEPQNPMKVKLPKKGILTAKEMKDFKRLSKNMSHQLMKLRETASIERNVSQQFGG